MGDAWRLADRLREYRGDAHTAAWTSAGFDATEIGLLTELYWGLPMRTYVAHRGRGATTTSTPPRNASRREACWPTASSPTRGGPSARRSRTRPTPSAGRSSTRSATTSTSSSASSSLGRPIRDAAGYPASGPHDLADAAAARP